MKIINLKINQIFQHGCLLLTTTLLAGCSTPMQYEGARNIEERHQFLKNYEIGQKLTVNVGDPVVKFQDYWLDITESPIAIATKNVNLKGGLIDITLIAGKKYPVRGKMTHEGVEYTVVATTESQPVYSAVLVRADGTLYNRMVGAGTGMNGLVVSIYNLSISDPMVRMVREKVQNVTSTKGYENFELLYTGTNSNGLNLTYREFSPEGLARIAFFQNLTYAVDAKNISFKKYKIAVDRATSESITFVVSADGH